MKVELCTDCIYADANGIDSLEHEPDCQPLRYLTGYLLGPTVDTDNEDDYARWTDGHFSRYPCDGCGTQLAGQRWEHLAYPRGYRVNPLDLWLDA